MKGKEHDFEELLLLSHDANHAKELAEAELRKFEAEIDGRRKLRYKEVKDQKDSIEERIEFKDKHDKKDKDRNENKLLDDRNASGMGLLGIMGSGLANNKGKNSGIYNKGDN